jgi:tRNA-2-methylthio-N6-dimethylallyladenosine synthase
MLVQLEAGDKRVTGLSLDTDETFDTPFARRDNPHRAYLTIIEGCDKSCAYCVVPFTRGPERSRTSQSVLDEMRELAAMGYTDVQFLGQNVNSYRDPSPAGLNFAQLLRAAGEVDGIRRVRFTTSHPRDFTKEIVDVIAANPVLCDHIHLPVQSGSTEMLKAMRRQYRREEYMRRIEWIKNCGRDIAITTDIIVGFPGETEADLQDTLSLLSEVEYDSVFTFKYSRRPNTPALALEEHMDEAEKARRLAVVMEHQRQIQIVRNANYVGRIEEVMVEGFNKATGQWIGRTSQNKTLNFLHHSGDEDLVGKYLPVRVTRAGPNSLAGESIVQ